jgi:xylulokinase
VSGLLLGIDAGTTSVKAGLYDPEGKELATASVEYVLQTPQPGRVELDPEVYWRSLVTAVRRSLHEAGLPGSRVAALGVSSQGETLIPVSDRGLALAPAIVWLDSRAVDEARQLALEFDAARVYATTGIPAIGPTWPACKLLWWNRHEPELFRDAARFLLVEDYLLFQLTGRFATEGGVQSSSLLYDIVHHRWWQDALDAVGVGPGRLGELTEPGSPVGHLRPEAAEELGLKGEVQVVAGGMDQGAGAVGVGNFEPGVLSESTGGALAVTASIDRPDGDPTGQTPVQVHSAPGYYLYCPYSPTGGMALKWFRDNFGQLEMERAAASGSDAYDLLTELAADVKPGCDGLTMLPHLQGAYSPEYEPAARGVFFGFTLGHGRAHFVRAVLESVAFMLHRNLDLLRVAGAQPREVRSHGGGARSALWGQIKADVCSLPVVTLRGSEAAVRGDAMLAGVVTGSFTDLEEAARAAVRRQAQFNPNSATQAAYDQAYQRYVRLFEAVRPLFQEGAADPA